MMFNIELDKAKIKYYIIILIRFYLNIDLAKANPNDELIADLKFDPMDIKFLIAKIETEFQIFIYDEELTKIRTISDIVNIVIEKKHPELLVKP